MSSPKIGLKAPRFKGDCTGKEGFVDSADLKGKRIVLYFYPKDSTPGCTTEGQNFRDLFKKFKKENTVIFGLSRESIKSHENFKAKEKFNFDLISDRDVLSIVEISNTFFLILFLNLVNLYLISSLLIKSILLNTTISFFFSSSLLYFFNSVLTCL